ncbi:MAG: hypothetical protein CNIPEHKO_02905 [Anaerolineales bacterium]|nr:hypothetical protein [Anaerolineales bacterium]
MNLKLSNPDFHRVTCPFGDKNKWRGHIGRIVSYCFQCLDRKVCSNMAWAEVDDPSKFCSQCSHPAKITVVS